MRTERRSTWIGFAAAVALAASLAGQPGSPKFDVISIRTVPPNAPMVMKDVDFNAVRPGGQYIDSRTILPFLIDYAYNIKMSLQLKGLPKWAQETAYEVSAKPGEDLSGLTPAENYERVRLMVRAMLADRFHLQIHPETRQDKIYKLDVAKGGFKLTAADPPAPPQQEGPAFASWDDASGRILGTKATVAGIARTLTIMMDRPVLDETGVTGYYSFDVKWQAPRAPGEPPPAPAMGAEGIALLMTNLQDQFGLRLSTATGPVEYWVVDHIEPPTEN